MSIVTKNKRLTRKVNTQCSQRVPSVPKVEDIAFQGEYVFPNLKQKYNHYTHVN